jgi:hypothetical protein
VEEKPRRRDVADQFYNRLVIMADGYGGSRKVLGRF